MEAKELLLEDIIISNGYEKIHYGYKKITKETTHWITLLDDGLQMYGYFTLDEDCDKVYDTGIVNVNVIELQTLINIMIKNHI